MWIENDATHEIVGRKVSMDGRGSAAAAAPRRRAAAAKAVRSGRPRKPPAPVTLRATLASAASRASPAPQSVR